MKMRGPAWLTLTLLAGCATVPSVTYHQLGTGARADNWVPFRLTDSIVVIGAPVAAKGDAAVAAPVDLGPAVIRCPAGRCNPIAIAAVPTDFTDAGYALEPVSRRLISTTVAPTYFPNSLRLKTLTVEAKDHRLEAINTVATIAAGAAKLAVRGGDLKNDDPTDSTAVLILPLTLRLPHCGEACPATATALPGNRGWTYDLAFTDHPAASGLLPRAQIVGVRSAIAVAACRPLRITLHHAAQHIDLPLDVAVADPDWLVTVPFPSKGAMTFHSLCGVDVQAQSVTDVGVDAMATAFVNGVEHVAMPK